MPLDSAPVFSVSDMFIVIVFKELYVKYVKYHSSATNVKYHSSATCCKTSPQNIKNTVLTKMAPI